MDRILMVEDDLALGTALEFSLTDEGYGMKPAAVLRSLSRARKRLETILEQEGYAL